MSFIHRICLLLLVGSGLSFASAQAPAPKQIPSDFSKEAYVVEHLSSTIRAEKDGTGTREVTAAIRVLADAGVKTFAVLNFTYTSDNEVMDVDYVRVRRPDGTIIKTPDYNIQDMPGEITRTAPLYSDIHEKHVAVKGLGVGDVLEYLIRLRTIKAQVPGQFWFEYSFNKKSIVEDERLEISLPSGKYVKIVSPDFKPEVKEEEDRRVYRWSHSNLIVKEKDPFEVPRRVPPNPDVQVTTFANWEEVGRWYGDLQKERLLVTPAIQAKASELTKGLTSDDAKFHALYNFVSLKFHYVGLDFGIGRYQPHAADDVLDNGYGDCKDKHTLMATLLKAAGYDAWPVLIHTQRKLDSEVPSPAQFNHVITVIPAAGAYIWLDTTPEVAPYRLLLPLLRNKQALVIPNGAAPRLMMTPENPPEPQRQEFSISGKVDSNGTFSGHAEQTYEGDTEVGLRAAFRQVPESQWKEVVQRFSRALNFAGDVSEVKVTPPDEFDKAFRISYDYVRKEFGDWENHHTIAPLPPIGIESSKYERDIKPSESVLLGALGTVTYRSRVELPEGYKVMAPPPLHLVESYAEYDAHTTVEGQVMTTTRELKVKKSEVALSEWEGYRKFGRAIWDNEVNYMTLEGSGTPVLGKKGATEAGESAGSIQAPEPSEGAALDSLFREGTSALQQRDFQRAQELFEKIIAQNADYKGAHFSLALALASRGDMVRSLEQLRDEERVSPEDPRAYQVIATYLIQTGKREEAIQEWRKLINVDPENRTAISTLVQLLYGAGKYQDAAAVLEPAVKTAPDSAGLLLQLGDVYMKLGQIDKAVASYRAGVEQKGDDPEVLNNVAYSLADNKVSLDLARTYAEKALQKLEEQAQGAESSDIAGLRITFDFSLLWDTLGWVYFQQGDVKRAELFVRAAWVLGEHQLVAKHLGEIYEREGNRQEAVRAYEFALAVSSAPTSVGRFSRPDAMQASVTEDLAIRARYEKLTGKKPSTEIRRLPNGQWTQTPAERLRRAREIKLSNGNKLAGDAQFYVTIKPDKVDSAEYASGNEGLEALDERLKAAHYPIEFPPDTGAILVVRVEVSCHADAPCTGTLLPAVQ